MYLLTKVSVYPLPVTFLFRALTVNRTDQSSSIQGTETKTTKFFEDLEKGRALNRVSYKIKTLIDHLDCQRTP